MQNESILELFSKSNIKPTAQRVVIAKAMLAKPQHLSAEQVLSMVNADDELVSKATVYNTLNLFVEKGFIKQVLIDPTKVVYDSNTGAHGHFYNEDSGELSDFDAVDINLVGVPSLPENTEQTGVDVIIRVRNNR